MQPSSSVIVLLIITVARAVSIQQPSREQKASLTFSLSLRWGFAILNATALNVSWQLDKDETEPSIVIISVNIYSLKPPNRRIVSNALLIDGKQRFNVTSMIINSDLIVQEAYYAIVIESNRTYHYGRNQSQMFTVRDYESIKIGTTPRPREEIQIETTSSSVMISLMWPIEVPYYKLAMNAELDYANTSLPIEIVSNETYLIKRFNFSNLAPSKAYRLVTTFQRYFLPDVVWFQTNKQTQIISTREQQKPNLGSRIEFQEPLFFFLLLLSLENIRP